MRIINLTAALIVVLVFLTGHSAGEPGVAPGQPASAEQIGRWIGDLTSGRFQAREDATQGLIRAGLPAVKPLGKAIDRGGLEVINRGLHILKQWVTSRDAATDQAAQAVLQRIANSGGDLAKQRASEVLQQRALVEIRRLGAKVVPFQPMQSPGRIFFRGQAFIVPAPGFENSFAVEIDHTWKGGEAGLAQLQWLTSARQITLSGAQVTDAGLMHIKKLKDLEVLNIIRAKITDAGLVHLKDMKQLHTLRLWHCPISDASVEHIQKLSSAKKLYIYGTRMTRRGADRLQAALAATGRAAIVDFRRGAFLGVGLSQRPNRCVISHVGPNTAASRAGLRVGDIVTKYNDQDVSNMKLLIGMIAEDTGGEKITLQIRRGEQMLTKQILLGEWGEK